MSITSPKACASAAMLPTNFAHLRIDPSTNATSSHSQHAAADAVLNNYELLHDIIIRLPLEDIVVATGVCRTWHKLKDSLAIQQALFLAQAKIRDITCKKPCLSKRIEDLEKEDDLSHCIEDFETENDLSYCIVGDLHPSITRICGQMVGYTEYYYSETTAISPPVRKSRFNYSTGIWRDMFVTQPPTKRVRIFLYPNDDWTPRMEEDRFEHSVFKTLESQTLYPGDGRKGRWLQESIPNYGFGNFEGVRMGELHDYIHLMADATTGEVGATARVIVTERTRLRRSMHLTENPSCWWMVEDGKVAGNGEADLTWLRMDRAEAFRLFWKGVAQLDERLKKHLAASQPIIDAAIFSVTIGMISVDVFA